MLNALIYILALAHLVVAQVVPNEITSNGRVCIGTQCLSSTEVAFLLDLKNRLSTSMATQIASQSAKLSGKSDELASFLSGCVNTSSICQLKQTAPVMSINPTQIFPSHTLLYGSNVAMQTNRTTITNSVASNNAACSHINLGPTTLNLGSLGLTIALRFQFTGTAGFFERLIDFNSGSGGLRDLFIARYGTYDKIRFQFKELGSEQVFDPTTTFSQNAVHDLIIVYDPTVGATGQVKITANGTLIHTQTPALKGTDKLYANTWIARSSYPTDPCSNFDIFSFKLFNRVMNVADVSF